MNFNYGMNFNVRAAKVEQKKPEDGEKGKEEKPEKAASPKIAPETVVLTGNATEIQAAINKATVQGAMGSTAPQQVRDGELELLESRLEEYAQLKDHYLEIESQLDFQEKLNYLHGLQDEIEDIVNQYQSVLGEDIAQKLNDDYTQWATELNELLDGGPEQVLQDPMEQLFYELDNMPNYLNPEFVYHVESGIDRVNYFRTRVEDYQQVLSRMNTVAQQYWGNNPPHNFQYFQFMELKSHFQQKLAEAQRYLQLSLDAIGAISASDKEESTVNIGQNLSFE